MELQKNIHLLKEDFDIEKITLLGVRLNQNYEALLGKLSITEKNIVENGWVNTHENDMYCYRVSDGKVIEFLIRKEGTTPLNITKEEEIQVQFGKADSIEKRNGWHYYFYSKKHLVISWEGNKVWGIYVGNNRITPKVYTAKDFLEIYLDFIDYIPNESDWNEEAVSSNPPRLYRLKRLKSLMKAFEIGEDLSKDFENGSFLRKRDNTEYTLLHKDIEKHVANYPSGRQKERHKEQLSREKIKSGLSLSFTFPKFLEVIRRADNLLKINSGVLEASTLMGYYTVKKVWEVANTIDREKLEEIKELLCSMIDPKQKTFLQKTLIEKYDFPDVDLEAIDMEWW